jgi:hypothetical protein
MRNVPIQGEEPPELMRHQEQQAGLKPARPIGREFITRIFIWTGVLVLPALRSLEQCSVYPAGIKNLAVISVTDTSVTFTWNMVTPNQTYYNFVVTTDSSYTVYPGNPNFVHFYHFQPDTVATQDSLQPGTKYYIFVSETRCNATDSVSFTTLGGATGSCPSGSAPVPSIKSSTGSFTVCGNGVLVLNSSSASGNTWYMNGQALDSTGSSLVVAQSGSYSLVVLYPNGCKDTSAVQMVTFDPGPATPVVTASGATLVCEGSGVTLYSSASVGDQWFIGSTPIPGQTGSNYSATRTGEYWVEVTDQAGCWAASAQTAVTVDSSSDGDSGLPTISPAGPLYFCADTTFKLRSSHAANYQWYLNGMALAGAGSDSLIVSLPGAYSVATDTGGCRVGGAMSAAVQVSYVGLTAPVISDANGVLVSSFSTGNQWYLNDSAIRGATHQNYTPRVPGSYTVRVGIGVRTIDTTTFQIGVGGCFTEFSAPWVLADSDFVAPVVLVYPNPAVDFVTLQNKRSGPVTVRIFNLMGQQVFGVAGMTGVLQVDVSRWGKGVYFVELTDQGSQQQDKAVMVKL